MDTQGKNIQSQSTQISTGISTISNLINSKGCVKSIQRGYFDNFVLNPDTPKVISLSKSVNPEKCVFIITHHSSDAIANYRNHEISSTTVTLYFNLERTYTIYGFDWQLIEFY